MIVTLPIVPKDGCTELALNMARIYQAEHRVDEIAITNEHKAPELMAFFNRAYIDATDFANRLETEILRAQKVAEVRKAKVILDEVPRILKEKGLVAEGSARVGGTLVQQESILAQDDEYQAAVDRVNELSAFKDLMDRKMKVIEMAYLGVRKIIGGDRMQWMPNKSLNHGSGQTEDVQHYRSSGLVVPNPSPLGVQTEQPRGPRSFFGSPRD